MIKAVVFDMDGVLIDAREWHYEALNRALGLVGHEISRFEHLSTYDGLPTARKLEMLSIERGLPRRLHRFLNEMKQIYTMELVHARCKPVFQHEFALSHLKGGGYKIAVASNSVRATVEVMMEAASLRPYIDVLLSNEDVKAAKPAPEIYEKAISLLGATAGETLVVEDNENGIRAAREAGAHVMVVGEPLDVTYDSIVQSISAAEASVVAS